MAVGLRTLALKNKLFTHSDQTEGASKNRRMPETYLRLGSRLFCPESSAKEPVCWSQEHSFSSGTPGASFLSEESDLVLLRPSSSSLLAPGCF